MINIKKNKFKKNAIGKKLPSIRLENLVLLKDLSRNILNINSKAVKFTYAALTIIIKSRLVFTNIGSVRVCAGSIHVTRVISFTFFNIWETIYTFALYHVCHFKMG